MGRQQLRQHARLLCGWPTSRRLADSQAPQLHSGVASYEYITPGSYAFQAGASHGPLCVAAWGWGP